MKSITEDINTDTNTNTNTDTFKFKVWSRETYIEHYLKMSLDDMRGHYNDLLWVLNALTAVPTESPTSAQKISQENLIAMWDNCLQNLKTAISLLEMGDGNYHEYLNNHLAENWDLGEKLKSSFE